MTFDTEPTHVDTVPAGEGPPSSPRRTYTFVDLFAGIGGFHVGLEQLGHRCVFACEIDSDLRSVYKDNFGIDPYGDIRSLKETMIPPHQILCAGFPCQPFSLAGKKTGTECPESGKLIDDVVRIARFHRPRYVLLENVPNVLTIADGTFWSHICDSLEGLGYIVEHRIYSPLQFGIPQQRNRLFVVARQKSQPAFAWPESASPPLRPLSSFLRPDEPNQRGIEPAKAGVIDHWNLLVRRLPELSSDTLIASEFGATYPLNGFSPGRPWRQHRGAFGRRLDTASSREDAAKQLPHYASENGRVPIWMRPYVEYSRRVYAEHAAFLDAWKQRLEGAPNSWQKLEWRGDRSQPDLWAQTLQFRASGIRAMRPRLAPSLVAMTPTQTPIIGPRRRYLAVREAAALQALDNLSTFPENNERAFRAIGNAVNAYIVREVSRAAIL